MRGLSRILVRCLVIACLCGAAQSRAQSGLHFSFEAEGPHGGERLTVLTMKGEVADGDLERLQQFLRRHPQEFIDHGQRVVLVVDGGDLEESIRIGTFLHDALIEIWLPDAARSRCVSACFFMFAQSASRTAVADSVGIHRPWFDADILAWATAAQARGRLDAVFARVRELLDALLVPRDLTETMLHTPWNETYWLTTQDLQRLGEHRAWFEDWFAARCGTEPGLARRLAYAEAAGFASEAESLRAELAAANICLAELRKNRRRELIDFLSNENK